MPQSECHPARGRVLSCLVGCWWFDRRAGSRRRHRPARAGLLPGLDQLEVRTLLSTTAATTVLPPPADLAAPVASETTWDLQLRPDGEGALSTLLPAIAAAGSHIGSTPVPGLYVVDGPPASMAALGARLAATPGVADAEPQHILSIAATPNDPNYTNNNEWQLNGTWGINAPKAWDVTVGSDGVIVADTDTGLNYNLADMNYNVWLNQAEIPSGVKPMLTDVNKDGFITFSDLNNSVNQGPGKIVDTNHDGVITAADVLASTSIGGWASGSTQDGATGNPDDLVGWNYAATGSNGITGTNNPMDDEGHGTFTASEIAAVGNNALGVTGVEWNAQLMPVKFLDSTGNGSDTAASAAIHYAVDHGAKVINASWGGGGTDSVIQDALQYANQHSVIVVCAAGNGATNDDTSFFAPASYSVQDPNVISVAATDSNGALASFSNYGIKSVQLARPRGRGVYSLESSGGDGNMSGTSMAAPLVTGTLALVWSAHPTWSMQQVIDAVLDHTTPDSNLAGRVATGGIVNATAAVANTDGPHVVASTTVGSVGSAGGFNGVQVTFNEEVDPSTFTAAQVALTGPNGAISGISVSAVSGSNNHQFVVSFPGQTTPGTYNLTVGPAIRDWYGNAMNQNRNGVNGESSDAFNAAIQETSTATATFLNSDTTTQGTWIGTYGAQGYDIVSGPVNLPSGDTITPAGQSTYTWTTTSSDPRALQVPGSSNRVAAVWYSATSFTVDVNLGDGQAHDLELYFDDWDNKGRAETVQVSDAGTGNVLDTETISAFTSGVYLDWRVSGNLLITVTRTAGANAVLNGLFLDGPTASATFSQKDTTTQGTWIGTYGAQGYDIVSGPVSLPSGDTITPAGQSTYTWTTTSTDPRALQVPGSSNRVAAVWYSSTSFTVAVNLGDGLAHNLELYFDDWDNKGRAETVQLSDAGTGKVLDTQTISAFTSGVYLDWKVSGNVLITITRTAGANALLNGLFLDGTTRPASATFLQKDTTTQGSWMGDLWGAGLRHRFGSGQPSVRRYDHARRAVHLYLDHHVHRPPRPAGTRLVQPRRRRVVLLHQLHRRRQPGRRRGPRPGAVLRRLGQQGSGRDGAGQRRGDRQRAGHRDDLRVHQRRLSRLESLGQPGDHDHPDGRAQRHPHRTVPRLSTHAALAAWSAEPPCSRREEDFQAGQLHRGVRCHHEFRCLDWRLDAHSRAIRTPLIVSARQTILNSGSLIHSEDCSVNMLPPHRCLTTGNSNHQSHGRC